MRKNIIVSGIPASGKSTVGRIIARHANVEFLDKDEILESLFETKGIGDATWRSKLSREADRLLQVRSLSADGAVVVSWWRHPRSTRNSGTSTEWLTELGGNLIEVYCECAPHAAAERFQQRRRHEGHLDQKKAYDELLVSFEEQALLGPLSVGQLIKVNTEHEIDERDMIAAIDCLCS